MRFVSWAWVRRTPNTFWIEFIGGLGLVAWGWYVIWSGVDLDRLVVYDRFTEFVPGWAWARYSIVSGALQAVVGVASWYRAVFTRWPRRLLAGSSMLLLQVMAVSMLNSEQSAAAVLICVLALMFAPGLFLPLLPRRRHE